MQSYNLKEGRPRKTALLRLKLGATTISACQFFQWFPDEPAAIAPVEGVRWPNGVICPHCDSDRTARQKVYPYDQCKDRRRKFTVRTGAIFESSHIPMDQWLYGMYRLQTARKGVSSLQLSKSWALPKSPPGLCSTVCGRLAALKLCRCAER